MSDFCYSRPMLHRVLQQAEPMDRMMERLGVDLATAARLEKGMAWYEARCQCIACHSERQCQEWLKRAPAEPPDGPPDFLWQLRVLPQVRTKRTRAPHS
jgi:hypothetical protein